MKTIPLTKGYEAIVDDADYEMLSQWKWHAIIVGRHTKCIYAARRERVNLKPGRYIYMHRQLMNFPPMLVDHRNINGLDNRRENLRLASQAQNVQHQRVHQRPGKKSYYMGVSKDRTRWIASVGGKHVGCFGNPVAAAVARDNACKELHGEFASLNFLTHIPLRLVT